MEDLHTDVLIKIALILPLKDAVNLSSICKKLRMILDSEKYWAIRLMEDFSMTRKSSGSNTNTNKYIYTMYNLAATLLNLDTNTKKKFFTYLVPLKKN
jgi:hypothetical protein